MGDATGAPGDRLIALRLPPGPRFVAELDAAWERGDAVLPVDPTWPAGAVHRALAALRPALVVDPEGVTPLADPVAVEPGVALVVHTSGTTGAPKGVQLTHTALQASVRASLDRIGARPDDRWLVCLPVAHVAGILVLLRSRLLRSEPVVLPRFDVAALAGADATHVSLVPTQLHRLLEAGVELGRFRRILLGGAAPPAGLLARAAAAGATVTVTYGLSETCGGCVYDGVPLDGVDVALHADGRIRIRGPVVMRGYRLRPDLTAAALHDGWVTTSDLGTWTADGRLRVLGRGDDVLVTGGEQVRTGELVALLRRHPAVRAAVVVGRDDPEWGQRVVAYCVPTDPRRPPDPDELRAFVAAHAPRHHVPREVVVVDRLPHTSGGVGRPD
ncbi:MAG TPA: AMP-binding protein [Nitriliruptorales bacterium]|nr:AMP-binding protein [Nitriliruptorales bacterium]